MTVAGLSHSEHPLGRLNTVFILIFCSLFHDAAKYALLVLPEDDGVASSVTSRRRSDDLLSDTNNVDSTMSIVCDSVAAAWWSFFSCTVLQLSRLKSPYPFG